jgi:FlaA1/EpsC-like NDP-sugar epimerase
LPRRERVLPRRPWTLRRVLRGIARYGVAALLDCAAVFAVYLIAVGVRTGGGAEAPSPSGAIVLAFVAGVAQVGANAAFNVYWRDWNVVALEDLIAIAKATFIVMCGLLVFNLLSAEHFLPYGAVLTGAGLVLLTEAAIHLRPRWPQIVKAAIARDRQANTLIVVGAGQVGQLLAKDLSEDADYRIAFFVDDDQRKLGKYVRGIRVAGTVDDLPLLIAGYRPAAVVIANAKPSSELIRRVVQHCEGTDVRVRAVRGFALGDSDQSPLRTIDIEELLGRDPVDLQLPAAREYLAGRTVIVTGAAGSIGSEIAKQVAAFGPARLLLLDINESGLHELLATLGGDERCEMVLGDIRDRRWLSETFRALAPSVVFHAAAYKHVPIIERSPRPGLMANVIGTRNVLSAATSANVDRLVFISSDKAVQPLNVLGVTKRFGELLTLAYGVRYQRHYCVVRFGNVLASSGSVVPLFTRQLDAGGPLTVTHRDTTRYFMTIREAAGLVIQAGAIASTGDLLVLDMGPAIRILDLARKMIALRGLRTPADIDIIFTGLRPGEKMHEDLLFPQELATGTQHPRVLRVAMPATFPPLEVFEDTVTELEALLAGLNDAEAIALLQSALAEQEPRIAPTDARPA